MRIIFILLLVGIFSSVMFGSILIEKQADIDSFIMAMGLIFSLLTYAFGLYYSKVKLKA